ncbi:MAG: hypothetical protein ACRENS_06165 [Candidatus Eiseniibacteriota bacterium]
MREKSWSPRAAAAALAAIAVASWFGLAASSATEPKPWTPPDSVRAKVTHHYSIKDSPGYVPIVDPESASVLLGRRPNAPIVDVPFVGGTKSMNLLGMAICRAVHHQSLDSLMKLCIDSKEFREILWPEFPNSRPMTGMTWDFAWMTTFSRLHGGCAQACRDYGGHVYQLISMHPDSVMQYKNFKMYSRIKMMVKSDEGETLQWKWMRGVVMRKGRYKIYSTSD